MVAYLDAFGMPRNRNFKMPTIFWDHLMTYSDRYLQANLWKLTCGHCFFQLHGRPLCQVQQPVGGRQSGATGICFSQCTFSRDYRWINSAKTCKLNTKTTSCFFTMFHQKSWAMENPWCESTLFIDASCALLWENHSGLATRCTGEIFSYLMPWKLLKLKQERVAMLFLQ